MAEQVCSKGTARPHGVTDHGVEGHRHRHNPLSAACSRNLPGEPSCPDAVCRACAAPRQYADPEPRYRCNCGQEFPSHLARVAHAATCPEMGTPDLADLLAYGHPYQGQSVTQGVPTTYCAECRAWVRRHPEHADEVQP